MLRQQKTIKMLLYDGTLNGVTNISDSAWQLGKMYSAPKESIANLLTSADCKKYGVYLLLSDQMVYVGQSIDLARRTKEHLQDKEWWTQVVLMTTKDNSFNASDIDYLEARLIEFAEEAGTCDSDNKNHGNNQKVDEFRQSELEQYLDEALFLLDLIGVKVFKKRVKNAKETGVTTNPKSNALEKKQNIQKPVLPDLSLSPGAFVKTTLIDLLSAGYVFTQEQLEKFGSVEGSKTYTARNLPMFWILKEGETRADCDKNVKMRYWKEEFVSGNCRFLMFSQWYNDSKNGATKENFIKWYESL